MKYANVPISAENL